MHPVSVIAIAASKDWERLTREVFGADVGWVPRQRPGFDLGLVMKEKLQHDLALKGLVMGQHDTSKAATNHLVHELAIELSPLVRVNGLAPATVVEGSGMFPRDRVISSLTKYNIPFDESESTEALRDKPTAFYAQRTLTKSPITLADQAEMAYLLSSSKFSKTTGQIIGVAGGLHEAFLR